jgi:hypothetical protein
MGGLGKRCGEVFFHSEMHLITRNDLARDRDSFSWDEIHLPWLELEFAHDDLEHRGFPSTILTHDGNLGIFTNREIGFVQDNPFAVIEGETEALSKLRMTGEA